MKSWPMYRVDWDNISRVLAAVPQVMAAWGFGSGQNGIILPGSDLDIGILWSELPTLERLALRSDLQAALQFDDIDLVSLNQMSPVVRFEAVCGRLIFSRCTTQRVAFVSLTAREYEDSMAMVQRALAARATFRAGLNSPHPNPLTEGEGTLEA
jgi:predicted nucleotidyltransferase